uniref:Uncharacterized protein n=1 Tax=Arsenophonus endosymbiont of Trialeurodes vaporariorum TaxID=235567 RepID=A0A3B0LWQ3_9GAMM
MNTADPKDDIYIDGTRFASQRRVNLDNKKIEWRLLEVNPYAHCYERVCIHNDPIRLAMNLISRHAIRNDANPNKTLELKYLAADRYETSNYRF